MFGCANNSSIFDGLTEPPYKILTFSATELPYNDSMTFLIAKIVSSACSLEAVFPVPIAQIGS